MPNAPDAAFTKVSENQVFRATPGGQRRITPWAVAAMRADYKMGLGRDQIEEKYGCNEKTVDRILSGTVTTARQGNTTVPEILQEEMDRLKAREMVKAFKDEGIGVKYLAGKLKGLAESEDERIVLGAVKEIGLLMGIRAPEKVGGDSKTQVNVNGITTPVTFLPENSRFMDKE